MEPHEIKYKWTVVIPILQVYEKFQSFRCTPDQIEEIYPSQGFGSSMEYCPETRKGFYMVYGSAEEQDDAMLSFLGEIDDSARSL